VSEARAGRVRAILLDIEGTTTPLAFVHQSLFPYARTKLRSYLADHRNDPATISLLERLRQDQLLDPDAQGDSSVEYVEWLMDRDRKSTPLKELQGLIWEAGYARGELRGDLYPDVVPALERWRHAGIDVGIFSSGSVLAQQLLFRHSIAGDLTGWLRRYFDTTTGSKRDSGSYRRIAELMNLPASTVLFVSDVVEELDAARAAGMQTRLSDRPGNPPVAAGHAHTTVNTFDDVDVR
jgi:enolase-phosphatase E1